MLKFHMRNEACCKPFLREQAGFPLRCAGLFSSSFLFSYPHSNYYLLTVIEAGCPLPSERLKSLDFATLANR